MLLFAHHAWRKKISAILSLVVVISLLYIALRIEATQASAATSACCRPTLNLSPDRDENVIPRLCGRLVFMVNRDTGVGMSGLIPCSGSSVPLIFKQHPRDIIPFYQFRDVKIEEGDIVCTVDHGCMSRYITSFKNYIGIDSCSACGKNVPPTWTKAPLTPYTPTPMPPTSTPYIPSATPTLPFTPAPWQVTATLPLFELLENTPLPSPTLTPSLTNTSVPVPTATPTPAPQTGSGGMAPLVIGIGFIGAALVLAYLAWVWTMREKKG